MSFWWKVDQVDAPWFSNIMACAKSSSILFLIFAVVCSGFSPLAQCHTAFSPKITLCYMGERNLEEEAANNYYGHHDVSDMASPRRRAIFATAVTAVTSSSSTYASKASAASTSEVSSFLATYSDPINHPGGKRTIKLIDGASAGDYALAQVFGGGGIGEPKEYVLPAVILGDRAIVIDFTPKGGPRDFTGVLEKDGSIRFLRDGNRWPRLE